MSEDGAGGPWICHVCDFKSTGQSKACSVCYKTTCDAHLRHVTVYNRENGLYELQPVCLHCAVDSAMN